MIEILPSAFFYFGIASTIFDILALLFTIALIRLVNEFRKYKIGRGDLS